MAQRCASHLCPAELALFSRPRINSVALCSALMYRRYMAAARERGIFNQMHRQSDAPRTRRISNPLSKQIESSSSDRRSRSRKSVLQLSSTESLLQPTHSQHRYYKHSPSTFYKICLFPPFFSLFSCNFTTRTITLKNKPLTPTTTSNHQQPPTTDMKPILVLAALFASMATALPIGTATGKSSHPLTSNFQPTNARLVASAANIKWVKPNPELKEKCSMFKTMTGYCNPGCTGTWNALNLCEFCDAESGTCG